MKLMLDENISYRIKKYLQDDFENVIHVSDVNLQANKDNKIFEYCRNNQIDLLISFDEDYKNIVLLNNIPPKIILLKTGNLTTRKIASLLISKKEDIKNVLNDADSSYLEIEKE